MPDIPIGQGPGFVEHINDSGTTTTVSNGATPNVKGAYTTLVASTAYDVDGLLINIANPSAQVGGSVDLAVGAAASEQIIFPDLNARGHAEESDWNYIPINIPAGTRIAARSQSNNANQNFRVQVHAVRGGMWGVPPGGAIETWGWVSGSSVFTAVNAGAAANTFGAWTQLVASTARDVCAVRVAIDSGGNTVPTLVNTGAWQIQLAVGAAASETLILGPLVFGSSTLNYGKMPQLWLPTSIPAGSRVSARVRSSTTDATDRIVYVGLYGLSV